jgi:muramoyltetrapeptide carboxypeptidase
MTGPPLQPLDRPRRLVQGDTVAVVATSGPIVPDRLRHGTALLESWGLRVRLGAHVLDRDATYPFLAGTDADRAADLQRAWCDPDVAAVLVARGGSGASRLIDRLDWTSMKTAGPKLLVGFSDVTALSEAVATRLGLVSLFGPMPATFALGEDPPDQVAAAHLRRTLFSPVAAGVVFDDGAECVVPGRAKGVLVGGTLSLLTMSVGTSDSRPANGGIAVLEDIGEVAFRLDNRLTHLLRAGWFDGVRAIVLGSWTDCGSDAVDTVIARLRELGVPMVAGLPIGHCSGALTMPLGVEAELDAEAGSLTLLTPALLTPALL